MGQVVSYILILIDKKVLCMAAKLFKVVVYMYVYVEVVYFSVIFKI